MSTEIMGAVWHVLGIDLSAAPISVLVDVTIGLGGSVSNTTVILVHGAYAGAWTWGNTVDELHDEGLDAMAITLPGHGEPGRTRPIAVTVRQCVAAIRQAVVAAGPGPVVLVGHSMGGYLIQRYLERRDAHAAVLVASVPRAGTMPSTLRTVRRHPLRAITSSPRLDTAHLVRSPEVARQMFFTEHTDQDVVDRACRDFQAESPVILAEMAVRPVAVSLVATPMTVVAGELDGTFTLSAQETLAAAYGTELRVIAGAGHNPMLEGHQGAVVDAIVDAASRVQV